MPHSALEIANEFIRLSGGMITQMKVQKLAYIAHGWNWAINGQPLIAEDAKAWPYGPVYPTLYEHTKYFGREPIRRPITPDDNEVARFFGDGRQTTKPYAAALSAEERAVIEHVWKRYGSLSAIRLSELTHQPNTPWFKAYRSGQGTPLAEQDIRAHYAELAQRASNAAIQAV